MYRLGEEVISMATKNKLFKERMKENRFLKLIQTYLLTMSIRKAGTYTPHVCLCTRIKVREQAEAG